MTAKPASGICSVRPRTVLLLTLAILAVATATVIGLRPLLPVDETRYLSVAWQMWWRGDFLVPFLNGEPYPDKPPLLFWAIHFAWWLSGVNETAARLVPVLFGLGSAGLSAWLARLLWPGRPDVAAVAPIVLVGMPVFLVFATFVMFDVPLTFFVLLGMVAVLKAARDGTHAWWWLFGLALGAGLLTKGPIAILHLLPAPLLAPFWWPMDQNRAWRRWYGLVALSSLAGVAMALAWALPAASAGGSDYAYAILWRQTAGRVVQSFAHARPWWFYPALFPLLIYPWGWVPALWRSLAKGRLKDPAFRFCVAWAVPPFLILMAVSGKQPHYLLPLLPALALTAARLLVEREFGGKATDFVFPALVPIALGLMIFFAPNLSPAFLWLFPGTPVPLWVADMPAYWGIVLIAGATLLSLPAGRTPWPNILRTAASTVLIFVTAHAVGNDSVFRIYDLARVSAYLSAHQDVPIAYNKDYEGEFDFLGRLKRPIKWVQDSKMRQWMATHPGARVVLRYKETPRYISGAPILDQQYRGHRLGIWLAPEKGG